MMTMSMDDYTVSCNPDLTILQSKPMLTEAVQCQAVDTCMEMVFNGVDPNETDLSSGDTVLHLAIRLGNLDLVKLLLAFHADPMRLNNAEETPLGLAERIDASHEIITALNMMHRLQSQAAIYNENHKQVPPKSNSSDIFLLSLDGGGIKITTSYIILASIEKRMKALSPDCSPLQSYFDYVAGTSAGGLLAATLFYENVPVQNVVSIGIMFRNEIVTQSNCQRQECLKQYLFKHFGEDTLLSDIDHHKVMFMTTIANVSPNQLHIMSSYGEPRDGKPGPNDRKLWEALYATMAAPGMFPPFEDFFMDGALVANNPTLIAMAEISEYKQEDQRLGCVLSIGTGVEDSVPINNIGLIAPNLFSVSSWISSGIGVLNLIRHFRVQATRPDGMIIDQASSWCRDIDASYFRLSTKLTKPVSYVSVKTTDVISLAFDAEAYVLTECKTIDQIAKKILSK